MAEDERDLRERLRALDTVAPHPAPVDDAVWRGRILRRRRVALAGAGVAAGVVLVAGLAVLLPSHGSTISSAASSGRHPTYTVTVRAPGPHAQAGLVASGTINGQSWGVVVDSPDAGQQNIRFEGSAFGDAQAVESGPALRADSAVPVSFGPPFGSIGSSPAAIEGNPQVQYGAVRGDVSYLKVRLDNGAVLTLHPATVYGIRAVAFAAPENATIASVTAYARGGEIATAIPFRYSDGPSYFGVWLAPGQHENLLASRLIGSGLVKGQAWSVTAYTGPWGTCLVASVGGPGGVGCATAAAARPSTRVLFSTFGAQPVTCGIAAPNVVRIAVTRSASGTTEIRPVMVGSQKFFAFPKALSWRAYDASGAVVASSGS